jgi:hypothetical protein
MDINDEPDSGWPMSLAKKPPAIQRQKPDELLVVTDCTANYAKFIIVEVSSGKLLGVQPTKRGGVPWPIHQLMGSKCVCSPHSHPPKLNWQWEHTSVMEVDIQHATHVFKTSNKVSPKFLHTQRQVKSPIADVFFSWLMMFVTDVPAPYTAYSQLMATATVNPDQTNNTISSHMTLRREYLNFSRPHWATVKSFAGFWPPILIIHSAHRLSDVLWGWCFHWQLGRQQQQQAGQVVVGWRFDVNSIDQNLVGLLVYANLLRFPDALTWGDFVGFPWLAMTFQAICLLGINEEIAFL